MMKCILVLFGFVLFLSGCAEYPNDAEFLTEGVVLRTHRLNFASVNLNHPSREEYRFKNVGFNFGKKPIVYFVVKSEQGVSLEELSNIVTVEIWKIDNKDKLIFKQSSALNAALDLDDEVSKQAWRSSFAESPARKLTGNIEFIGYANRKYGVNTQTEISRFGEYKVVVSVSGGVKGIDAIGFVSLSTTWK